MCGIAGLYALNQADLDPEVRALVSQMTDQLVHRGPDGEGLYLKGSVCLGHRRLAIIDLSTGHQPMVSWDNRYSISYNGEIYNFKLLKKELQARGAQFKTQSDTEVILEAYRYYGRDCVKHLEGMFALAIYDKLNRTLFLARDRFGKKPLFYTRQNNLFYFASEIRALTCLKHLNFHLDREAIAKFLAYEYVPGPATIYQEISILPPSYTLTLGPHTYFLERYFDIPSPNPNDSRSLQDITSELLSLLRKAVAKRLISEVPLGVFLSGGIDSSLVTALMAEQSENRVKSFSIGFKEASYDESKYARLVAKHFATDHTEEILEADLCADLLPEIIQKLDVPLADASLAPTYLLSRLTRRSVTVALGGDGSDELLAGYENYQAFNLALLFRKFPKVLQKAISFLSQFLPKSQGYVNLHLAMQTFLKGAKAPDWLRIESLLASFDAKDLEGILSADFKKSLPPKSLEVENLFEPTKIEFDHWPKDQASPLARSFHVYLRQFLPEDILLKVDRCSMLHSLEVRAPFLDTKLAEFIAKLPLNFKLSGLKGKWILRKALKGILPETILQREKRGFQIPVAAWLKGKMRPLLEELLDPKRLKAQGILDPKRVQKLMDEHFTNSYDHRKPLWTLLVLELWLKAQNDPSF